MSWQVRRLIKWLAVGLGFSGLVCLLVAAPAQAACEFFSEPQRFNTRTEGDVIVIGGQRQQPYRVMIIGDDEAILSAIRECVLDAFVTRTRLGTYIQVGSFASRQDAETIRRILQKEGYHPRVIYIR